MNIKHGNIKLVWIFAMTNALAAVAAADIAEDAADSTVALVYWMRGKAIVEPAAKPLAAKPLQILDRLEHGSTIRTEPGAEIQLAFFDGQRFALGGQSRAVVESGGLEVEAGSWRRLESVPPLVQIPRLASSENPGKRPGTDRIRTALVGSSAFVLWPREQAVLSDAAILHFGPIAVDAVYRVEVLQESGKLVFATETNLAEVTVPGGVLEPETLHYWQVVRGGTLLGSALFTTLSAADARLYRQLAELLHESGDSESRLLLAVVEHHLGLGQRACEGLSNGAELDRPALRHLLSRFDCPANSRRSRHETAIALH